MTSTIHACCFLFTASDWIVAIDLSSDVLKNMMYNTNIYWLLSENHHECSNFFMISTFFKQYHNIPNYNDIFTFICKRNRKVMLSNFNIITNINDFQDTNISRQTVWIELKFRFSRYTHFHRHAIKVHNHIHIRYHINE